MFFIELSRFPFDRIKTRIMLRHLDSEKMFKWLPAIFLAGGILLVYLQVQFDMDGIGFPGIGLIGMSILTYGIVNILRFFLARVHAQSIGAQDHKLDAFMVHLHAAALMLIGAGFIAYAPLMISGWADEMFIYLRQRPGMIWLYFGILGIAFSLTAMLRTRVSPRQLIRFVANLPSLLSLLLVMLLGVASVTLGVIEQISPSLYQQMLAAISARLSALLL